jgi:hypothetical protein
MLGNLNLANNKITNLAPGTATTDAATWAQLFGASTQADIASAATTDIGVQNTSFLRVTGTTTITSFGTNYRGPRFLTFADAVTLTNSSTLVLPGGADITTAAGDSLIVIPGATSGTADKWVAMAYQTNAVPVSAPQGLFCKASPDAVAFTKTGNFTVSTATQLFVEVNGVVRTIASATVVTMPSATTGTDYAIWCKPDGTLEATSNHTSPPVANSRKIGGFHYAPGGNATAQSGGNTTPQINEYSFWDLKFRPNCPDPRGMTLVAGAFWSDIYRTGVDHHVNGSSRFNVAYARGTTPPKRPLAFGGNGSATYSSFNWWEASEVAKSHGKRLPTYGEYAALAYGTTENSSVGTDQNSTVLNAAYTSKWGVIQSSGVLWSWGDEFATGSIGTFDWFNEAGGRGNIYQAGSQSIRAALFGGSWLSGVDSGSRASYWSNHPVNSDGNVGVLLLGDHLQLD